MLNKYGSGNGIYIGAPVFMHARTNEQGVLKSLIDFILSTAGVGKSIHVNVMGGNPGVEARILQTEGSKLLIVLNHSGADCKADIDITGSQSITSVLNAETGVSKSYSISENGICISVQIESLGVQLYKIEGMN